MSARERKHDVSCPGASIDVATEAVQVSSRDGTVATGERLRITTQGEQADPHVELNGNPARVVNSKNGTVISKAFLVDPRTGFARVPGEGSLKTVYLDGQ